MAKKRDEKEVILRKLAGNRRLAHRLLFPHRHGNDTPEFLNQFIDACHDRTIPRLVCEGFRGCGKSTTVEEVFVIGADFKEFRNGLIVAESETRALERLAAIKNEFVTNEMNTEVFGAMQGPVWTEHKIVLANEVAVQARGRGQSLRGTKHLDFRPDFVLIDDLENDETVATPEARRKTKQWLFKTLLPALAPDARVIWIGNRLDDEAVIVEVSKDPDWRHMRFPIKRLNDDGEWEATWPDRFPLDWIDRKEAEYRRLGILRDFANEYMCEGGAPEEQAFTNEMMRIVPRVRTWEATWAMFDPARTVSRAAARTGFAAWSWIGPKLVVWRAWGRLLMPNEIIDQLFVADREFRPVAIGIEKDGLNEWLEQPLRAEQAKRGHTLPVRAESAPRDKSKIQFIKALQPYFNAREVEFAEEMTELKEQLLSIPRGQNDVANALAYALKMRPGAPIYDDFTQLNVAEDILPSYQKPLFLAMNATRTYVTAALVQYTDGLRVFADWVEEGEPAQVVRRIIANANLECGQPVKPVGPPIHFDQWNNVGLRQAVAALPGTLQRGGQLDQGRQEMRRMLREQVRGRPAVLIGSRARWTLNAFSGGYARDYDKGNLSDYAREGPYRILVEGIESFSALIRASVVNEDEGGHYAYTRDGRRYRSARA